MLSEKGYNEKNTIKELKKRLHIELKKELKRLQKELRPRLQMCDEFR